ncbi:MAG TPA: hypothetical protein VFG68_09825 [Fimbriiglobus sp.]|nr:hypothetical protein [Fimbriiglobus sp.]
MRQKRVFWAVVAALVVLWIVANTPRTEESPPDGSYTTKKAGWPDRFARWSSRPATGETFYSSFSVGSLLFDLAPLVGLTVVAWFLTWPQRTEEPEEDPRRSRRLKPGQIPTRRGRV